MKIDSKSGQIAYALKSVLTPHRVMFTAAAEKRSLLQEMIKCLADADEVTSLEDLEQGIFHREKLMSTGIGFAIAVPHVRLDSVTAPVMCAAVSKNGIADYESLDAKPIHLIFMIAAGKNQHELHIRLLAFISTRLKDEILRNKLIDSQTPEDFYNILITGDHQ